MFRFKAMCAAAAVTVAFGLSTDAMAKQSRAQVVALATSACEAALLSGDLAALEKVRQEFKSVVTACSAQASTAVAPASTAGSGSSRNERSLVQAFFGGFGRSNVGGNTGTGSPVVDVSTGGETGGGSTGGETGSGGTGGENGGGGDTGGGSVGKSQGNSGLGKGNGGGNGTANEGSSEKNDKGASEGNNGVGNGEGGGNGTGSEGSSDKNDKGASEGDNGVGTGNGGGNGTANEGELDNGKNSGGKNNDRK